MRGPEIPGRDLVPAAPDAGTGVVGTMHLVDGELVVRMRPAGRDATARRVPREPDPEPTTLSSLPFMRYVGPLTPAETAQWYVDAARWSRPWWRRWL